MKYGPVLIALTATVLLLGACGGGTSNRDLKMAPESSLPAAMREAPVAVREAYQFAVANLEIVERIPCYCGCGDGHGGARQHINVKDCFVQEVRADGTVVWDDMGLG